MATVWVAVLAVMLHATSIILPVKLMVPSAALAMLANAEPVNSAAAIKLFFITVFLSD
jgi:hypothetical protein